MSSRYEFSGSGPRAISFRVIYGRADHFAQQATLPYLPRALKPSSRCVRRVLGLMLPCCCGVSYEHPNFHTQPPRANGTHRANGVSLRGIVLAAVCQISRGGLPSSVAEGGSPAGTGEEEREQEEAAPTVFKIDKLTAETKTPFRTVCCHHPHPALACASLFRYLERGRGR